MKKLISRFSKYDEWGYRNPQFDKLKKVAGTIIMTGAVVARWAHNPKVVSSSLAPATKQNEGDPKVNND